MGINIHQWILREDTNKFGRPQHFCKIPCKILKALSELGARGTNLMNKFFLLALSLILIPCSLSHADYFNFTVRGYPKEDRNCHLQAASVGQQFEKYAQVKVVHVECVTERKTGYDFFIEYDAPARLEFTSTDYFTGGTTESGRYREQSECLTNLPPQTELFKRATGLNPIFSYCRSQELSQGKNWEIIIIARDKSALQPQLGGFLFFSQPQGITGKEVAEGLQRVLEKHNGIFAELVFHNNSLMGMGSAGIHYYAPKSLFFNLDRVSKVPTLDMCFQQAQEVKAFLQSERDTLFTIYCGGPDFGEYELHLGTLDKPSFTWKKSADTFGSLGECEANKKEVLAHYAGSPTAPLLGGHCSKDYETLKYFVMVYKKKPA